MMQNLKAPKHKLHIAAYHARQSAEADKLEIKQLKNNAETTQKEHYEMV